MYSCATKLAHDLLNWKLAGDPYPITQTKHIRRCSSWFGFENEKIKHVRMEICSITQLKVKKRRKTETIELRSLYSIFRHNYRLFYALVELCNSDKNDLNNTNRSHHWFCPNCHWNWFRQPIFIALQQRSWSSGCHTTTHICCFAI